MSIAGPRPALPTVGMCLMRSPRKALVASTVAGALAVSGGAIATSAEAAGAEPSTSASVAAATSKARTDTRVRFLTSDRVRGYGTKVVIRGQVIANRGGGPGSVPGVRVKLYRKLAGQQRWSRLDKDYTSQRTGIFRLVSNARGNGQYKVVYAGNDNYRRSKNTTSVAVYRFFNAKLEDGSGRFHGKLSPRYARKRIHLEKRSCADCGWDTVRSAKTGKRSQYSFKVGAPRKGRWWWRVSTPASTRFIRSHSSVFTTERG